MSSELFFITCATSFVGSNVLHDTLEAEAGHHAHVSVRRQAQIRDLEILHPRDIGEVNFVVLAPDISIPDAFNHVLHGVDYIFHTASPMRRAGTGFQKEFVEPAVAASELLLRAAS
ncbi:hypothetical protein LTR27_009832 [Elasticomyces elasticus]|nr:hypothetical protein LTR27_009832 [Elasticomyces elasticus]